jgi:hypothetical protein
MAGIACSQVKGIEFLPAPILLIDFNVLFLTTTYPDLRLSRSRPGSTTTGWSNRRMTPGFAAT